MTQASALLTGSDTEAFQLGNTKDCKKVTGVQKRNVWPWISIISYLDIYRLHWQFHTNAIASSDNN